VDNEKIACTLRTVEAEIKDATDHEEGVIVGKDGSVIWRGMGGRSSITNMPFERLKDNIFTHNHPSGGCAFSLNDIETIIANDGYEVRAVTQDGRFVSFKKGAGEVSSEIARDMRGAGLTTKDTLLYAERMVMEKYGRDTYRAMSKETQTRAMMPYIEAQTNSWMRENTHKYGYIFTEGRL